MQDEVDAFLSHRDESFFPSFLLPFSFPFYSALSFSRSFFSSPRSVARPTTSRKEREREKRSFDAKATFFTFISLISRSSTLERPLKTKRRRDSRVRERGGKIFLFESSFVGSSITSYVVGRKALGGESSRHHQESAKNKSVRLTFVCVLLPSRCRLFERLTTAGVSDIIITK